MMNLTNVRRNNAVAVSSQALNVFEGFFSTYLTIFTHIIYFWLFSYAIELWFGIECECF